MVEIARLAVAGLATSWALIGFTTASGECRQIVSAVLPDEMEYPVCLCESLERAERAAKSGRVFVGMAGGCVHLESGCMEEFFVAQVALKGQAPFVALEMVVHRVLIALRNAAVAADIVTGSILLIGIRHRMVK